MNIQLNQDDIADLRSLRTHPGSGRGHCTRLEAFGLVVKGPAYNLKALRADILADSRKLKKCMTKLALPTAKTLAGSPKRDMALYAMSTLLTRIANCQRAIRNGGDHLSDTGKALLRDIDAAVKAAKWTVDQKNVTLEVSL